MQRDWDCALAKKAPIEAAMPPGEAKLASINQEYLSRMAKVWIGRERIAVRELVRSLDEAAFALCIVPKQARLTGRSVVSDLILLGAASALEPLLRVVEKDPGGVPWGPTSPELASLADLHLSTCGRLSVLRRLAGLERYGLAQSTLVRDDHLVIEIASSAEDTASLRAERWLQARDRSRAEQQDPLPKRLSRIMRDRMDDYANVDAGWFIRYDNDEELIAHYRELAVRSAVGCAEARALPDEITLGGRSFRDWMEASITANGRVLQHVAFSTHLVANQPGPRLRNLLTIFARKDDIRAVWEEAGADPEEVQELISSITLSAAGAAACERIHEIPLPYYVDYGTDFLLLPVFGGLLNPCAGMVWELKRRYRREWDQGVAAREGVFREDLRSLFRPPRVEVLDGGRRLRRPEGSLLTDIDGVVVDHQSGSLGLFQLKWYDAYGRSLAERNSRRLNLVAANEWVARVAEWIRGRNSAEVATALGLRFTGSGRRPPCLFVIARHAARFSGDHQFDQRAVWAAWPEVVWAHDLSRDDIDVLWSIRKRLGRRRQRDREHAGLVSVHSLPGGLTVEVRS